MSLKINVVNKKSFRSNGEYIGRPSPLGNPFIMNGEENRELCVKKYRVWLWQKMKEGDKEVLNELNRLLSIARKGELNLICWCAPLLCHGDVISLAIQFMDRDKEMRKEYA